MKIIIPIIKFGKGGGHRVLMNLANHWKKNGIDVEIVVGKNTPKNYYPTIAKIVYVDEFGKNSTIKSEYKMNYFFIMKGIFKYLKRQDKKTVVIANKYTTAYFKLFKISKNYFYYIQAYEPEFYDSYKGNSIKKNILKFLAWLTYFIPIKKIVNADIYKNYKNIKSEYVVPPGLDMDIYYPKKLSKYNKKTLIVGCIGRIEEWKGCQDVGKAIEILHKKGLNIKLKVAFNPIDYKNYELIKPDGDENLADYYRSLDVLVAPGHIQLGAIHYPVIEGMACNVPVITTGYYPATNENSFIVPIKSPEKIAETLESIYYNYEEAYNKALIAQEKIKEFDWEIIAQKFLDIIKKEVRNNKNEKI
ncbi:MAG: glycosyltransferase family 4 protein [Cetobacterium sp.]|uniref:glycosyltransferase family 4 protein n=1 Tax=Cetobacterium sp. TaxID=2071632 RepID=UPI003F2CF5BB